MEYVPDEPSDCGEKVSEKAMERQSRESCGWRENADVDEAGDVHCRVLARAKTRSWSGRLGFGGAGIVSCRNYEARFVEL